MAQSIYNESRKTGTRGGIGLFAWESLDKDAFKINYLGNSVKAPSGRMAKEKDVLWYDKDNTTVSAGTKRRDVDEDEMVKIRQQESDALNIALGIMPVRRGEDEDEEEPVKKVKRVKKEKKVKVEEIEAVEVVKEERRRRSVSSGDEPRRRRDRVESKRDDARRDQRHDDRPREHKEDRNREDRTREGRTRDERHREERHRDERPRSRDRRERR